MKKKRGRHNWAHFFLSLFLVFCLRLPLVFIGLGLVFLGCWTWFNLIAPINFLLGVFWAGTGSSLVMISAGEIFLSFFWQENKAHCPFCRFEKEKNPQKILLS